MKNCVKSSIKGPLVPKGGGYQLHNKNQDQVEPF